LASAISHQPSQLWCCSKGRQLPSPIHRSCNAYCLEADVLAALCQEKALSFKNISCLVRNLDCWGWLRSNKLHIDKRKWLRFDEESTIS
jgi:hypothetical protein